jgi:cation:H+ antiporter
MVCALVLSLVLLGIGSEWLISGSIEIAHYLGVSELFIALTLVALGTSLPELTTSLIALYKGEKQMAVGNIIGSNIFNLLGVGGISALLSKKGITAPASAIWFDMPVMLAASIACLPLFFTGHLISRYEGIMLLLYYFLYITYITLAATSHQLLPLFQTALWFFIIPLTVIAFLFSFWQHRAK